VMNGDAVIAIDGSTGTLSELGHALDMGRPVAGLETHAIDGVEVTIADDERGQAETREASTEV